MELKEQEGLLELSSRAFNTLFIHT